MENITLKRVAFGYSPKQVDGVIDRLISDIEHKDEQLARFGKKFKELSNNLEDMERQQILERALIADIMISARKEAEMTLSNARK